MSENQQKSETAKREEATLAFWKERDIFRKTVERDAPHGDYVFYDGPPFATGLPHYGHIVASVIKDVVPRFWTMRGYRVPRVWGWDCHGLPIENIVEKELGFKHKKDIKAYGIAKFNERCREQVLTYAHEWEKIIPRIGRWADMKNAYRTMDKPFMESVWWVFKQLFDKGLIYEDYRSMHICPRCETTLSQQEVSEGYKDVKDIAVTVKFKVKNPEKIGLKGDVYMLAWTTTPWTLPGNVALAVGSNIDYIDVVEPGKGHFIVARDCAGAIGLTGRTQLTREWSGQELVGLEYEPPFDYYINDKSLKNRENGWKVYAADFVTTDTGTGIAHEAPAFGADDWELLKRENLPFVQHVNMDGTFKPEVKDFAGMEVKSIEDPTAADVEVIKYLAHHGTLFAKEKIEHPYPHCWRCDTPLLNYATSSWFVNITKIKPHLLDTAKVINWSPEHIKEGRWGNWLGGARDWSISRQRFWASVIPLWVCEKCKTQRVFGSAAELEEAMTSPEGSPPGASQGEVFRASGKKVDDLHKHIIDEIAVPCTCGGVMRRVPDVLDTWFDSGSMPYGEKHYPFENKSRFDKTFPAQFIAEGLDQTRAWFYYLHVLAGAIFRKNAFQNVIVNGIVLGEDGKKMSKKLQNYPDPMDVVDKYGADALRFYLLSSPVMQGENLSFSEKGVDEIAKKNIGRLGNVLAFYQLYADDTVRDWKSENVLDRWIIARLDELIREATKGYEAYRLDAGTRPITEFIDDLSVWYLRRSRERFKEEAGPSTELGASKKAALATLRFVLHRLSLVMAPSMPFFAEHLFQAVRESEDEESVHMATWPKVSHQAGFWSQVFSKDKDREIIAAMLFARSFVTMALMQREKEGIRVRQPLAKLSIGHNGPRVAFWQEVVPIIEDEVNVKEVVLDPRVSGVILDTKITPELREEGFVRDTIRAIQGFRKESGMKPGEAGTYTARVSSEERAIIEKYRGQIEKTTHTAIQFG